MRHAFLGSLLSSLLIALTISSSGCSLLPESMQPNQLRKLNYGSNYPTDAFESIPDSDASTRQEALRNAFKLGDESERETDSTSEVD